MHSTSKRTFKLGVILLCSVLCTTVVAADKDDAAARKSQSQKTRKAQAVSKLVYDKIIKAQDLVDAKDFPGALKTLNNLYNPDKLTEYEQANVLNYLGFVYYNMDDIDNAILTYERMVAVPTLEDQMRKQTTYTLAQLYTMEEQYRKALSTLDRWFLLETNPAPDPFILKAQNLYQVQRYSDMIRPIENAIRIAKARNKPAKEDWYVLLNFAYFTLEDYRKVRDIQKILLVGWPKKRYWFSLAGAFTELGDDDNLINSYGAAHDQGMLEKESELVTMAQLYLQREVPYKAGQLLEKEMNAGRISKNAKNYRLLSQAWQLAMEDEKAIPALREAARRSEDGELNIRLGNAYLNTGRYNDCVKAVRAGIRKGDLKSPDNAQISLGMCLYNQHKYNTAIKAFQTAGKTSRSRKISNQWIKVIRAEIARNEQIDLAEKAARKKRQELQARRLRSSRV